MCGGTILKNMILSNFLVGEIREDFLERFFWYTGER